jgi:hypothetical protein
VTVSVIETGTDVTAAAKRTETAGHPTNTVRSDACLYCPNTPLIYVPCQATVTLALSVPVAETLATLEITFLLNNVTALFGDLGESECD